MKTDMVIVVINLVTSELQIDEKSLDFRFNLCC